MKFRLGLFDKAQVEPEQAAHVFDTPAQRDLARDIACKSIVLLKNAGDILPLRKDISSIAVIGPNADNVRHQMGDYSYPAHIETLLEMIEQPGQLPMSLPDRPPWAGPLSQLTISGSGWCARSCCRNVTEVAAERLPANSMTSTSPVSRHTAEY